MTTWYTARQALSYGTPWIFSMGNRSIGKSFDWCSRLLLNARDKGEEFIYLRRYAQDLKKVGLTCFDEVINTNPKLKDLDFAIDGKGGEGTRYFINGIKVGQAVPLSGALRYKSSTWSKVTTILFDEFIPEDDIYLYNEVGLALNFYQTVARGNGLAIRQDCRFVFLGNAVTMNNPYFRELHIREHINPSAKFTVDPDRAWVVEISNNEGIANQIAATPFGKMISKTRYGEYALKNQFYLDDKTFIQKPTGRARYYCTLQWLGKSYGIWEYYDQGLLYITQKADTSCKNVLALSTSDHAPNLMLLYKNRANPIIGFLKNAFDNAYLRFDGDDSKYMFLEFMQYVTTVRA